MKNLFIYTIIVLVVCFGCGNFNSNCKHEVNVSDVKVETELHRLEDKIINPKNKTELLQTINQYPDFFDRYLGRQAYPSDSMMVNDLMRMATDSKADTLLAHADSVFADFTPWHLKLQNVFKHVKYYFPAFKAPTLYTVVSGFYQDVYLDEKICVIGLDYFLGERTHFKPILVYPNGYRQNMPNYMLHRYQPNTISRSVAVMVANKYIQKDPLESNLLAEMIAWGKAYYFADHMLPCQPDSLIIGYTDKQWAFAQESTPRIWDYFVNNELFFETDHFIKRKYADERPNVPEISQACPGRIAQYLGWKIVEAYAEKTKLSLPEVLAEPSARKIFEQSRYKPL